MKLNNRFSKIQKENIVFNGKALMKKVNIFLYFFIPIFVMTIWDGLFFYLVMKDLSLVWSVSFWIASMVFISCFLLSKALVAGEDDLISKKVFVSNFLHIGFIFVCFSFIILGSSSIWLKFLVSLWGAWKIKSIVLNLKNIFEFKHEALRRKKEKYDLENKRTIKPII